MNLHIASASPLYLQHGSALGLDIDQNQRLCIERKDQTTRRIPIHHISRIVCGKKLNISSQALMACMSAGIPICIVNIDGTALGWCMGIRRKETSLRQLLVHALDDAAWLNLYKPWLRMQEGALAAQTLLLCGVAATPAARRNPRAALCNAHFQKHQKACARHVNALAAMAEQEMAAQLEKEIGDPTLLAWYLPGQNLILELGQLLALHAHTDIHHTQDLPADSKIQSWAVIRYEENTAHWQHRIAHLAHAFEQFLRSHWL